jgi:hypothetical protein
MIWVIYPYLIPQSNHLQGSKMARTEGSGWGGGTMYYQVCPKCGKKKCLYSPLPYISNNFKCTWCKERFNSPDLLQVTFVSQLNKIN